MKGRALDPAFFCFCIADCNLLSGVKPVPSAFQEAHAADKRIEDGLPFEKAVLATAYKLIRIIFVLLTRRTMLCHQETT